METKQSHITLELVSMTTAEAVDLVIWGPYFTKINKIIGETAGVVRGENFALGIQSLNIKTLGGYPWNESDRMPEFDIFRQGNDQNMHPETDGSVLYRIEAAKPTGQGSSLQAYCRNRFKERIVEDFDHDRLIAPAYDDGGVTGSKIAIFGCPVDLSLETIGMIELTEGLPHPLIDGKWAKTSAQANAAYLITAFTEETVDHAIALTKKAGLKYLYHYGKTFENWGHFDLYKGEFPNGIEGLKKCVEKAEAQGIKMGTHCLSNFISPNDPYVTPIPDLRLAKVGSSVITGDLDATATEIPIESPDFFNQMKNNHLKTVMIGDELIRYSSVSKETPWRLMDCQRGAFGTFVSQHKAGTIISKLLDHGYKVFLTEADLTIEMSRKLAELYNETGLRQISFDGLEGNRSTGLGTYGESLMPYTWFNELSADLKDHLIIDASRTTHFFWHIYTRMNWGEPWYAGFRESQTEYRFNNQAYFKRNFMPGMLGWFRMTSETTIEDIEWMLAKSAGYEAGYALVADMESIAQNGFSEKILQQIGDWEQLRLSNSFNDGQKLKMRNNSKEFSIQRVGEGSWNWSEVFSYKFVHTQKFRQPGEPLFSTFNLDNPCREQIMQFMITASNCDIHLVSLEIDNYKTIQLPVALKAGQILRYTGSVEVELYSSTGQLQETLPVDPKDFLLREGAHSIQFDCVFDKAEKESEVKFEVRLTGEIEVVRHNGS
ncbi:MAG TPA: hypothetical protein PLU49_02880 [Saprospiraceae bacterium]|nr:hypothetical protein [Saprospiraceae bacterium]